MQRPTRLVTALSVLSLALGADDARAQRSPLSVAVHGGTVWPSGSFSPPSTVGDDVDGGASFGVHFFYRRGSGSEIYFGFSQHRFDCSSSECPDDEAYVWTGWDVGTRFYLTQTRLRPWVRVGGVFARVERNVPIDGAGGLSDLSAGAEAGVGLSLPVGRRFRVETAGRYVWLNAIFPREGLLRMRYFVSDLGLNIRF